MGGINQNVKALKKKSTYNTIVLSNVYNYEGGILELPSINLEVSLKVVNSYSPCNRVETIDSILARQL